MTLRWVYDDGGRADSGRRGDADDCVCRAIAIATGHDYAYIYDDLAARQAATGKPRSARNGIDPKITRAYLADLGWVWTPTMSIGSGCQVHLTSELYDHAFGGIVYGPALIARLSGHLCAVKNGAIHDTYDPSRDGTRCVYGFFQKGES
jgi:hypothetical protein